MKNHNDYIYILTRVTNDLIRRVYEHKMEIIKGFTQKYNVKQLVYFEHCEDIMGAIHREKVIKKWKRKFKIDAIEKLNPHWKDLYYELADLPEPEVCLSIGPL